MPMSMKRAVSETMGMKRKTSMHTPGVKADLRKSRY